MKKVNIPRDWQKRMGEGGLDEEELQPKRERLRAGKPKARPRKFKK